MYKGIIEEVFIPGFIDKEGSYSSIMKAEFLGFRIKIQELIYSDGRCERMVKDHDFYNKQVIVVEKDTHETARYYKGDSILVKSMYFNDACECIMEINDGSTYMIINMSDNSIIEVVK